MGIAMLGTGRNQLSKGLLRQVAKARDVRTLASLSLTREATRKVTSSARPVLSGFETGTSSSVYRTFYTSRVLGDEVKVIVCPAFADSVSEDEVICEIETDKTSTHATTPHGRSFSSS